MQEVPWFYAPPRAGAEIGSSVSGGDLNGDGYADIVYGAPADETDALPADQGSVSVFYGGPSFLPSAPDLELPGEEAGAWLGAQVAVVGDLNGDGFADLAASEPWYDVAAGDEGRVLLWYGALAGLAASPSLALDGDQQDARFGEGLGRRVDTNGDGYDDLLVGEPEWNDVDQSTTGNGRAHCFLGGAAGISTTAIGVTQGSSWDQRHRESLAGRGDVSGDGYSDFLVGAPMWDVNDPNAHEDQGAAFL